MQILMNWLRAGISSIGCALGFRAGISKTPLSALVGCVSATPLPGQPLPPPHLRLPHTRRAPRCAGRRARPRACAACAGGSAGAAAPAGGGVVSTAPAPAPPPRLRALWKTSGTTSEECAGLTGCESVARQFIANHLVWQRKIEYRHGLQIQPFVKVCECRVFVVLFPSLPHAFC
jgi:hypothetical protein